MSFLPRILAFVSLIAAVPAQAVTFGHGVFIDPPEYLARAGQDAQLKKASEAVVLIGGRASGVIVTEDGLMITSAHVIRDLYIGKTDDCRRMSVYLHHQLEEDGGVGTRRKRVQCGKILEYSVEDDFVLVELKKSRSDQKFPFVELSRDPGDLWAGQAAIAIGHPNASNFSEGVKKISSGHLLANFPDHAELPHFLHRIDTEGGSSGGAIVALEGPGRGKLIGLHFRGIEDYAPGVDVVVDGKPARARRFNVALPVGYLAGKYGI